LVPVLAGRHFFDVVVLDGDVHAGRDLDDLRVRRFPGQLVARFRGRRTQRGEFESAFGEVLHGLFRFLAFALLLHAGDVFLRALLLIGVDLRLLLGPYRTAVIAVVAGGAAVAEYVAGRRGVAARVAEQAA